MFDGSKAFFYIKYSNFINWRYIPFNRTEMKDVYDGSIIVLNPNMFQ